MAVGHPHWQPVCTDRALLQDRQDLRGPLYVLFLSSSLMLLSSLMMSTSLLYSSISGLPAHAADLKFGCLLVVFLSFGGRI